MKAHIVPWNSRIWRTHIPTNIGTFFFYGKLYIELSWWIAVSVLGAFLLLLVVDVVEFPKGGGIIRDCKGFLVAAFAANYGDGSNNIAEFCTLRDGMALFEALNLHLATIESDSMLVIQSMQHKSASAWQLSYVIRDCLQRCPDSYRLDHVYRQRNMVANRLADWVHTIDERFEFFREMDLPSQAKSWMLLDHQGIWMLRH